MSRSLFSLSDEAWAAIEPHLPKNQLGARKVDDGRVISSIIHMLKSVAAGQIILPKTALRPRSIIDGIGGPARASGRASWQR
jgi:transposase